MTGPDGTKVYGYVQYISVDAINSFTAKDAFSDTEGDIDTAQLMTDWVANFEDMGESTKLTIGLTFATQEEMQKIINMGFEAGFTESLSNFETHLAQ